MPTKTTVTVFTTAGPQIDDPRFQGWYIHPGGSLEAINCPIGSTLLTTSNYGYCCVSGGSCSIFATTCLGSTAAGGVSKSISPIICGETVSGTTIQSFCQTLSIFDSFPTNDDPVYTQIICAPPAWVAFSVFRNVVLSTTAVSTISVGPSPSATSILASNTQSGGGTGNSPPNSTSGSSSKVWIAAAVIGPVALIAIIALLLWILRLRKRNERPANSMLLSSTQHSPEGSQFNVHEFEGYQPYGDPYPHELQATNTSYELPAKNKPYELPAKSKPYEPNAGNEPIELSDLR